MASNAAMADDADDLALDWHNTFFVVGVSLAVVVAVLVVLPHLRARFAPAPQPKPQEM